MQRRPCGTASVAFQPLDVRVSLDDPTHETRGLRGTLKSLSSSAGLVNLYENESHCLIKRNAIR